MNPAATRGLVAAATCMPLLGTALALTTGAPADVIPHAFGLPAVAVGWLVVVRRPESPVGPAVAWCSAAISAVMINDVLSASWYTEDPMPVAAIARHFWAGSWPLNLAGLFALLLVFPDGRRPGRLWSTLPWSFALAAGLMAFAQWDLKQAGGTTVGPTTTAQDVGAPLGALLLLASLVGAIASVVVRYRAGDERTRLQVRWLLLAAGAVVLMLVSGFITEASGAPISVAYAPFLLGIAVLIPAAVGTAVVRHDLFDVDRILGTGTAWALTLVLSAAIYGVAVLAVTRLVDGRSDVAPAAAAFATALAFLPLHHYVARVVARLVDRDRFVAVAAVERFAREVRLGRQPSEGIEAALREAQGDPGLRLAVIGTDGSWSDVHGRPVPEPTDGYPLEAGGDTIARISLGWDSARARRRITELGRAAWVPIEVTRLRLGLQGALDEVEASRTRLAEAAASERKRLERDLHDGAQQRIIATGMRLRALQRRVDATAADELDLAVDELEGTVQELRRMANGVRPSRLDDGLGPALDAVCEASPVPVDLDVNGLGDPSNIDETTTLATYLLISEAVTNALKHARADLITVRIHQSDGTLRVRVSDDGVGGVPADGLIAIRDRVASVGGTLQIDSPCGVGTTVEAVI